MSVDGFMRISRIGLCPWPDDDYVSYRSAQPRIRTLSMDDAALYFGAMTDKEIESKESSEELEMERRLEAAERKAQEAWRQETLRRREKEREEARRREAIKELLAQQAENDRAIKKDMERRRKADERKEHKRRIREEQRAAAQKKEMSAYLGYLREKKAQRQAEIQKITQKPEQCAVCKVSDSRAGDKATICTTHCPYGEARLAFERKDAPLSFEEY